MPFGFSSSNAETRQLDLKVTSLHNRNYARVFSQPTAQQLTVHLDELPGVFEVSTLELGSAPN